MLKSTKNLMKKTSFKSPLLNVSSKASSSPSEISGDDLSTVQKSVITPSKLCFPQDDKSKQNEQTGQNDEGKENFPSQNVAEVDGKGKKTMKRMPSKSNPFKSTKKLKKSPSKNEIKVDNDQRKNESNKETDLKKEKSAYDNSCFFSSSSSKPSSPARSNSFVVTPSRTVFTSPVTSKPEVTTPTKSSSFPLESQVSSTSNKSNICTPIGSPRPNSVEAVINSIPWGIHVTPKRFEVYEEARRKLSSILDSSASETADIDLLSQSQSNNQRNNGEPCKKTELKKSEKKKSLFSVKQKKKVDLENKPSTQMKKGTGTKVTKKIVEEKKRDDSTKNKRGVKKNITKYQKECEKSQKKPTVPKNKGGERTKGGKKNTSVHIIERAFRDAIESGKIPKSVDDHRMTQKDRIKVLQKIRNVGVWIECCNPKCAKMRYVDEIKDPADVPYLWYCHLNKDVNYNSCQKPEQERTEEEEFDLICTQFTAGSIVWAQVAGFPYWPAMVEDDPEVEQFYWVNDYSSDYVTDYHVTFFDSQDVTRAWVPKAFVKPFNAFDSANSNNMNKGKYCSRIKAAKEMALRALKMDKSDRLETFSFINRYEGPIVKRKCRDIFPSETAECSSESDCIIPQANGPKKPREPKKLGNTAQDCNNNAQTTPTPLKNLNSTVDTPTKTFEPSPVVEEQKGDTSKSLLTNCSVFSKSNDQTSESVNENQSDNPAEGSDMNETQLDNPVEGNDMNETQMDNPVEGSEMNETQLDNPVEGSDMNETQMVNPVEGSEMNETQLDNPVEGSDMNETQMVNPVEGSEMNETQLDNPVEGSDMNETQMVNPVEGSKTNKTQLDNQVKVSDVNETQIDKLIEGREKTQACFLRKERREPLVEHTSSSDDEANDLTQFSVPEVRSPGESGNEACVKESPEPWLSGSLKDCESLSVNIVSSSQNLDTED